MHLLMTLLLAVPICQATFSGACLCVGDGPLFDTGVMKRTFIVLNDYDFQEI